MTRFLTKRIGFWLRAEEAAALKRIVAKSQDKYANVSHAVRVAIIRFLAYEGDKEYLKSKIISVKFENPFKSFSLSGVKILKSEEYFASFEIDLTKISVKEFIDFIIKKCSILDINISGTPIEEVITKIYQQK